MFWKETRSHKHWVNGRFNRVLGKLFFADKVIKCSDCWSCNIYVDACNTQEAFNQNILGGSVIWNITLALTVTLCVWVSNVWRTWCCVRLLPSCKVLTSTNLKVHLTNYTFQASKNATTFLECVHKSRTSVMGAYVCKWGAV